MLDERKRTMLLGLAFLFFLLLSSLENTIFFQILGVVLQNQLLAVAMLFIHNILVISLILLGMTFYVNLVLNFFKKNKYERVVLEHPRIFAIVFTIMIVFLSILRGATLLTGGIVLETLPLVLLISAPIGIVEGYGIYLTIKKTLSRTISLKDLIYIYGIFLIAAVMEVGFIELLKTVAT
ncbi:MAG TPA: hypothetical protein VMT26_05340 [Candidatus Bathyarchaeia archaeon]|nr:hypothetical protein [Candidatus Bathyarchaeia archaeon]